VSLDVFPFVLVALRTLVKCLPLVSLDIRLLRSSIALLTVLLSLLLRHLSASFGRG
jgi:hypothetical protein